MGTFTDPGSADAGIEPYLSAEEVAQRLGVPLTVLIRRVEAGDVPARRASDAAGPRWWLRLSDLGVETDMAPAPEETALTGRQAAGGPPRASRREGDIKPGDAAGSAAGAAWHRPPEASSPAPDRPEPTGSSRSIAGPAPPDLSLLDFPGGPRQDIAGMSLDPGELVAGLLDRWERTLEQRIHAEHRQRFESELVIRQNLLKQMQLELQAARADHAAAQAQKDRLLADMEHQLADRERELADLRAGSRRRGWLFRR